MPHEFPVQLHPIFRRLQQVDLDALMAIEEASFPTPWSRRTYERELTRSEYGSYWIVRPGAGAEDAAQPLLAYGGMWHTGNEAHVTTIAVHPKWRRRGLGVWTLVNLIGVARARGAELVTLEVRISNGAAIQLYQKLGFRNVGTRRNYYMDTKEDALLMTLFSVHEPQVWKKLEAARTALESQDGDATPN